MNERKFYEELIRRQAEHFLGVELYLDKDDENRLTYLVSHKDEKSAMGLTFIFCDDYIVVAGVVMRKDCNQKGVLDATKKIEKMDKDNWDFGKTYMRYTEAICYELFYVNPHFFFEEIIGPMYEIIETEFVRR